MRNLESKLQIECVKWFRLQYPKLLLFAIPNGGKRNVITASILKAEGVVSGAPDIMIAQPNKTHHGLFIEMKVGKNKPTPNQIITMLQLKDSGYHCEVCYSFDSFKEIVEKYLSN